MHEPTIDLHELTIGTSKSVAPRIFVCIFTYKCMYIYIQMATESNGATEMYAYTYTNVATKSQVSSIEWFDLVAHESLKFRDHLVTYKCIH